MAEKDVSLPLSQENVSLPLSQETVKLLMQLTNTSTDYNVITDVFNSSPECNTAMEQFSNLDHSSFGILVRSTNQQISRPLSSLPASENYPGDYTFNVSFNCHENAKWVFSKEKNKLYVAKDVSFPVNFSTNDNMMTNVTVRALVLFSSPEHASESVKRCLNHSKDELEAGLYEAEHLLRSESPMARYEISPTGLSVVVPFENPAVGQQFSSYIYKFRCWGSCAGGPNRRPLMVVFTLENGDQVVGRQKFDVKICANPARDFKLETEPKTLKTKPYKRPISDDSDITPEALPKKSSKKHKTESDTGYTIKVRDRKCYQFLMCMRNHYSMFKLLKQANRTSDFKYFVLSSSSSELSSSECEKDETKQEN